MARIAYMLSPVANGGTIAAIGFIQDSVHPGDSQCVQHDLTIANGASIAAIYAVCEAGISAYCTENSLGAIDSFVWMVPSFLPPAGLVNAPQAAITDAPADAVTNYNIVTTLLGTLTSAVNDANTKQNAIATKVNSLLAELRTLGLIAT